MNDHNFWEIDQLSYKSAAHNAFIMFRMQSIYLMFLNLYISPKRAIATQTEQKIIIITFAMSDKLT